MRAGACWALVVALAVAGCLQAADGNPAPTTGPPAAPAAAPKFPPPVTVHQAGPGGAEPGVAVHPDGDLFVVVWTAVYRSGDGGGTFARLETPFTNNGDADLGITPDGTLHYVGMPLASQPGPRLPYYRSTDKGETWSDAVELAYEDHGIDRQFLTSAADGSLLVLTWNDIEGDHNLVRVSRDQGETWEEPFVLGTPRAKVVGASAVHGATILQPLSFFQSLRLAQSLDGGRTWRLLDGPAFTGQVVLMPSLGFDAAGTAYLAAGIDEGNGPRVRVWSSHDQGRTWSEPARLVGASSISVMPWLVAGASGRVAVAFYERDLSGGASDAPWYAKVVVSHSAELGTGWVGTRTTTDPIRTRDICTGGAGCTTENWDFKDLFEMALTAEGRPFLAWMKTAPPPPSGPLPISLPGSPPAQQGPLVVAAVSNDGWTAWE